MTISKQINYIATILAWRNPGIYKLTFKDCGQDYKQRTGGGNLKTRYKEQGHILQDGL